MIKVTILYTNQKVVSLEVSGHANIQSDIELEHLICGATSIVVTGALNAISGHEIDLVLEDGYAKIVPLKELTPHDQVVVETLITQLETIKESYPKYIRIKKENTHV